jgi:hypothetical protein
MNRYLKILGLAAALLWSGTACAQQVNTYCVTNPTSPPYKWAPCSSLTPNAASIVGANGIAAQVNLDGYVNAVGVPFTHFTDTFSTGSLDTTTNWTANNSGGTTAVASGMLTVSGTTTASQWGGLSTKQSWNQYGIGYYTFAASVSFNTLAVTNSVRIFGWYTSPATPTLAAPITSGYVFRLDATGALFAEIWSAGAAINSTNITNASGCTPVANSYVTYFVQVRTNLVQFGCVNSATGVANQSAAIYLASNPGSENLPLSAFSIAGLSNPGSAATMSIFDIVLVSTNSAAIKSGGQAATINDPAEVVTLSPNSVAQATAAVGTAALATNQVSVTSAGVTIVAARTGVVGTGRKTVCVTNVTGTAPIYIGNTGVSTSTGQYIPGTAGASICLDTQVGIFGIVSSTSQTVSYTETY